jgi:hypothetical protein
LVGGNAPVLVDDPSRHDGIIDTGKQADQSMEIVSLDAKLFVRRGSQKAIFDYLDLVGTSAVHQPP